MELTDDYSQHPSSLDVAEWRSPPFQMTKSEHFVGKQINLWKGRHLFEVFIQFLSSGIRDWLSLHQAGVQAKPTELLLSISAFLDKTLPDCDAMGCWFTAVSGQEQRPTPEFQ